MQMRIAKLFADVTNTYFFNIRYKNYLQCKIFVKYAVQANLTDN